MNTNNSFLDIIKEVAVCDFMADYDHNILWLKWSSLGWGGLFVFFVVTTLLFAKTNPSEKVSNLLCAVSAFSLVICFLSFLIPAFALFNLHPKTFSRKIAEQTISREVESTDVFRVAMNCYHKGCRFAIPGGVMKPMTSDPDVRKMEIRPVRNPLSDVNLLTYLEGKKPVRLLSAKKDNGHYYGYFSLEDWSPGAKVTTSKETIIEVNLSPVLNYLKRIEVEADEVETNNYNHLSKDAEKNFEASRG